ncbi:glucohydrolase [Bifidobacterium sp. BRDM6]|uniref:Glucohydrolase n=1 Tax=Bifidobacterium choloepi TaxID=2614131 RepID=A0A6I5N0B0_9BIFI|nr:glucohydrolase [Bifidobacterium choloepi]
MGDRPTATSRRCRRARIPDFIHTNGATPNPWWANAVIYRIDTATFADSNGDGIGDLEGIVRRLDYLADLGVDVVWPGPVFLSPQRDDGYDVADYRTIDPIFGTMKAMDKLIYEAHRRGIRVMMDLVANHTSDEHPWFQASRDRDGELADWYWWRPARPGHEPGTPGAEPNGWGSYCGGSAWQFDPRRGEYYLHQYSVHEPDLNWEHPAVRNAIATTMNWWLDRGVDGFCLDAVTQISKATDIRGRLPGEPGSDFLEGPRGKDGFSSPFPFCSDGPRLDGFLRELRRATVDGRDGCLLIGQGPGISPARSGIVTDPASDELDMLLLPGHLGIDLPAGRWRTVPCSVRSLRHELAARQAAVRSSGWTALFAGGPGQCRPVSGWGDDSDETMRVHSAKALAMLLQMHRGTPIIYQGDELGLADPKARRAEVGGCGCPGESEQAADSAESTGSADGVDAGDLAGTQHLAEPDGLVADMIDAAGRTRDPESVYSFTKQLITLRHISNVVAAGTWHLVDDDDPHVYAFTRRRGDLEILVAVNLSGDPQPLPASTRRLLPADGCNPDEIVLTNYTAEGSAVRLSTSLLDPWEALMVII